jgi:hypothetical protein
MEEAGQLFGVPTQQRSTLTDGPKTEEIQFANQQPIANVEQAVVAYPSSAQTSLLRASAALLVGGKSTALAGISMATHTWP